MSTTMVGEARYGLGVRSTNVDIADGNDTPIVRFTGPPVSAGSIIGNAGNISRSTATRPIISSSTT